MQRPTRSSEGGNALLDSFSQVNSVVLGSVVDHGILAWYLWARIFKYFSLSCHITDSATKVQGFAAIERLVLGYGRVTHLVNEERISREIRLGFVHDIQIWKTWLHHDEVCSFSDISFLRNSSRTPLNIMQLWMNNNYALIKDLQNRNTTALFARPLLPGGSW